MVHSSGAYVGSQSLVGQRLKRDVKIWLMHAMKHSGAFYLSSRSNRRGIPILCYHGAWGIDDGFAGDGMFILAETFARRMRLIDDLGLRVVALDDAVAALNGGPPVDDNSVVITIDDGWYSTYRYMMPVLLAHGYPATLYCDSAQVLRGGVVPHVMVKYVRKLIREDAISEAADRAFWIAQDPNQPHDVKLASLDAFMVATDFDPGPYLQHRVFEYMTAAELREFSDAGLDVQLHTHNHTMGDLSTGAVVAEVRSNAAALAGVLGRTPQSFKHFCYPSGVNNAQVADGLKHEGIVSATTTVTDVARPSSNAWLLPRIIDGDNMSEIEFEAELSGLAARLRWGLGAT